MTDSFARRIHTVKAVCSTNRVPLVAVGGFFLSVSTLPAQRR